MYSGMVSDMFCFVIKNIELICVFHWFEFMSQVWPKMACEKNRIKQRFLEPLIGNDEDDDPVCLFQD